MKNENPQDLEIIKHFRLLDYASSSERLSSLIFLLNLASNKTSYLNGKCNLLEHLEVRFVSSFSDWPQKEDEKCFLSAIENYYYESKNPIRPVPNAIANLLVQIAYRTGEVAHRSRKLISKLRFSWIRNINTEALNDAIQQLNINPLDNEWLIHAFDWEKSSLDSKEKSTLINLADSFRLVNSKIKPHVKILFGCAVYSELLAEEKQNLLDSSLMVEDVWRPYCLYVLASVKGKDESFLLSIINNLFSLIENKNLEPKIRIDSAKYLQMILSHSFKISFSGQEQVIRKFKNCVEEKEPFNQDIDLKFKIKYL